MNAAAERAGTRMVSTTTTFAMTKTASIKLNGVSVRDAIEWCPRTRCQSTWAEFAATVRTGRKSIGKIVIIRTSAVILSLGMVLHVISAAALV